MSLLDVRHVTVRFGGNLALNDVSLTAEAGHITGLIGPNGAGKTTLFNVVTGLITPERGAVFLGGRDIARLVPYKRARAGVARTFQRLELFGLLSVRENVEVAASLRGSDAPARTASELLDTVGLRDVASIRADELPTGTARLVELARALATQPRVLLLDEPASGQGDREIAAFRDVLLRVARTGMAIVLVEHDVRLVMRTCQVVHVLDLGAMLAVGTPEEVQNNPAVLAAYLGSSVEGVA